MVATLAVVSMLAIDELPRWRSARHTFDRPRAWLGIVVIAGLVASFL